MVYMDNTVQSIQRWFELVTPENVSVKHTAVQLGVGYEETSERAKALGDTALAGELHLVAERYKAHEEGRLEKIAGLTKEQKVELLDALCDEIVTRIGEAYRLNFDIIGALDEVNKSNYSKIIGGVILDKDGKVGKGKEYRSPKLVPFIGE